MFICLRRSRWQRASSTNKSKSHRKDPAACARTSSRLQDERTKSDGLDDEVAPHRELMNPLAHRIDESLHSFQSPPAKRHVLGHGRGQFESSGKLPSDKMLRR